MPGASATTARAIATAAARVAGSRKSTAAFSARIAGSVGAEREGGGGVLRGGGEVLHLERELGERAPAATLRGSCSTTRRSWPQGLAGLAAPAQDAGIGEPGGGVLAVQAEDVAQLDHRPVRVALGEQRQRALVVGLGALLGGVAGGERQAPSRIARRPKARIGYSEAQRHRPAHAGREHSGCAAQQKPRGAVHRRPAGPRFDLGVSKPGVQPGARGAGPSVAGAAQHHPHGGEQHQDVGEQRQPAGVVAVEVGAAGEGGLVAAGDLPEAGQARAQRRSSPLASG